MLGLLKRYRFFLSTALITVFLLIFNRQVGIKAVEVSGRCFIQMLLIVPPIFILIGLLDVWVPRETMVKYMGEGSGLKGIILAFFLGSAAVGPLYGAFPVAAVLMKKGAKFTNILILMGAWSTTKIPMFLFEMSALSAKFAFTRLAVDIPGIILMAYLVNGLLKPAELKTITENISNF